MDLSPPTLLRNQAACGVRYAVGIKRYEANRYGVLPNSVLPWPYKIEVLLRCDFRRKPMDWLAGIISPPRAWRFLP